ncbi:MAG: TetR/AcrR family transcriptional regulator [Kiritimatiellae bacterium]|nr:TetR/AcrR family transcriptional regulator [Kiritimatiellia bacterium]
MRRKVDHARRRREIVTESLRLFGMKGYAAVNFGMIAQACEISRTTLYTYFKDKRAIFNEAIDEATSRIEAKYAEIVHSRRPADVKLRQICVTVHSILFDYYDFVCVISDYLARLRRTAEIPVAYIKRHTIGLRRIMHSLIVEAKARGEYPKDLDSNRAIALLWTQFEATGMRITTTGGADLTEAIDRTNMILSVLRSPHLPR